MKAFIPMIILFTWSQSINCQDYCNGKFPDKFIQVQRELDNSEIWTYDKATGNVTKLDIEKLTQKDYPYYMKGSMQEPTFNKPPGAIFPAAGIKPPPGQLANNDKRTRIYYFEDIECLTEPPPNTT